MNNDRLNRIVGQWVSELRFIIMHSKRIMNITDHLYGISMQERGVSTRVGVQLTGSANVA